MDSLRITPLDPSRPSLDLLEDLLYGIHGGWLIFEECAEPSGSGEPDDSEDDGWLEDDEHDDAYHEAQQEQSRADFTEAVRALAAEDHDRLL